MGVKGGRLTCDRGRADFKHKSASLLITANSTAFANQSTSELSGYMSSPVVRGTTCMVQHLSCAHTCTITTPPSHVRCALHNQADHLRHDLHASAVLTHDARVPANFA